MVTLVPPFRVGFWRENVFSIFWKKRRYILARRWTSLITSRHSEALKRRRRRRRQRQRRSKTHSKLTIINFLCFEEAKFSTFKSYLLKFCSSQTCLYGPIKKFEFGNEEVGKGKTRSRCHKQILAERD